jgi:Tfp pilus assembly protein PilO
MELTALVNKHKNKIVNIAIIILAIIISANIYKKQADGIETLKTKKGIEKKNNDVIKDINQLVEKINSYEKLFTKKDASLVINTITGIAKQSGIKIVSMRPDSEQAYPNYVKLPFGLTVSADNYHAIGKFISKLEGYQDVYIIDSAGIRFDNQSKEFTVNLRLSALASAD